MEIRKIISMCLVFAVSFILIVCAMLQTSMPSNIDALTQEGARLEVESNNDFLIFYAVLFFTCVVGTIELLPSFEEWVKKGSWEKRLLSFLYAGLLFGMLFSISSSWRILRENHDIIFSGKLENGIKDYISANQTIFDHLLDVRYEAIIKIIIASIFELLYFAKIKWL